VTGGLNHAGSLNHARSERTRFAVLSATRARGDRRVCWMARLGMRQLPRKLPIPARRPSIGSTIRRGRVFHPIGLMANDSPQRLASPGEGLPVESVGVVGRVSKGVGLPGGVSDITRLRDGGYIPQLPPFFPLHVVRGSTRRLDTYPMPTTGNRSQRRRRKPGFRLNALLEGYPRHHHRNVCERYVLHNP
jgi:hypothetical protein